MRIRAAAAFAARAAGAKREPENKKIYAILGSQSKTGVPQGIRRRLRAFLGSAALRPRTPTGQQSKYAPQGAKQPRPDPRPKR